jgi:TATA-box binding protein (TBP) (component of TFIID and TFIIIB)
MLDDEWEMFLSNQMTNDNDVEEEDNSATNCFGYHKNSHLEKSVVVEEIKRDLSIEIPKASDIYISTKTKIAYLNTPINLKDVFWNVRTIPYAKPCDGVIKKQMKFNSTTQEELDIINEMLKSEPYYEEHVITNINNPSGRIKFKDIRKISVGVSKKDLMSYRCKKKSAFYNCFVLILRKNIGGIFKEFHVKIFNTGKMEIPGVQTEENFQIILQLVIQTIQPYVSTELHYIKESEETVLINSNFNCGYFINREALNDILKYKYNIQAIYDPCSYPGIQCKFYYNPDVETQSGSQILTENKELYKNIKEVSFMIFRTGSVLIVGKCDESVLFSIYDFLKKILSNEYTQICQKNQNIKSSPDQVVHQKDKDKVKKIRRKIITVSI